MNASRSNDGEGHTPPSSAPVYSFVLPAHNEAQNIQILADRIREMADALEGAYEIIWVNDGSTDDTAATLERLAAEDPRVRPIHLSRQFGHMAALTAGLEAAEGVGAVIMLDSDGQHPPELIPEMVKRWKAGADIVQTIRLHSPNQGPIKRVTSRLFYKIINFLGDSKTTSWLTSTTSAAQPSIQHSAQRFSDFVSSTRRATSGTW